MTRRTVFAGCALLLAASLLTGCQEGTPTPKDSRSPSTDPPGPSVSRKLPVEPKAASEKTEAGAKAFTLHYYRVVNYGRITGDWAPLKALSMPECKPCADFWSPKPTRMANKKPIQALDPRTARFDPARDLVGVELLITTLRPPDKPTFGREGVKFSDLIQLNYHDGHWKVKDISIQDVG